MAEISYPFSDDSPGGGSKLVSETEWQAMARLWGGDRIDFQLTANSYTGSALPLSSDIVGSDLVVQPGAAWVGGFYYKNDSPLTKPAPTNSGSQPRIDLVVLRADMSTKSVNVAIKTGTPAANPTEPAVQRTPGGIWEMPLCIIRLAANNGARTVEDRRCFDSPGTYYVPWNAQLVSESIPVGNFVVDMDNNLSDAQWEGFRGRDGFTPTRHLGKRRPYTPDIFTVSNKPAAGNRKGFWRYIAPGTVFVSIEINNTSTKAVSISGGGTTIGFYLPVTKSKATATVLQGVLSNPEKRDGIPNLVDIVARGTGANTSCYLYYPNPTNPREGLDGLKTIPGKSTLTIQGVYETNQFD